MLGFICILLCDGTLGNYEGYLRGMVSGRGLENVLILNYFDILISLCIGFSGG